MDEIMYNDMDERYFTAKRKQALESLEDIKKRMLEKYPLRPSEATPESYDRARFNSLCFDEAGLVSLYPSTQTPIKYGQNSCYPNGEPPEGHYEKAIKDMNNTMFEGLMSRIRPNSDLLNSVISDLEAREQRGMNKYGTTMDRNDLSQEEWLKHLYDELLDAALYAKKQIITIKEKRSKTLSDLTAHDQELGLYDEPKPKREGTD